MRDADVARGPVVHLFDAKFKLRSLLGARGAQAQADSASDSVTVPDAEGETEMEDARAAHTADDINKMHAYRDATGAQSVWVLYPGTESVPFRSEATHGGEAIFVGQTPRGVGAIALPCAGLLPSK